MITLILGGNKSGKSDHGLDLLRHAPGPHALVATGKAMDQGFRDQIMEHRRSREPEIPVLETDTDLPRTLIGAKKDYGSVLVDSLDFWIFSCMEAGCSEAKTRELLDVVSGWTGPELFFVSAETGLCPVPGDSVTRTFVRTLGGLNMALAKIASQVFLVTAGLPTALKKAL